MTVPVARAAHKQRHATGGADVLLPSDIGAVPTGRKVAGHALTGDVAVATGDLTDFQAAFLARAQALGLVGGVLEANGVYPNRPATTSMVIFKGADMPANTGTTAGGTPAAVPNLDVYFKTA